MQGRAGRGKVTTLATCTSKLDLAYPPPQLRGLGSDKDLSTSAADQFRMCAVGADRFDVSDARGICRDRSPVHGPKSFRSFASFSSFSSTATRDTSVASSDLSLARGIAVVIISVRRPAGGHFHALISVSWCATVERLLTSVQSRLGFPSNARRREPECRAADPAGAIDPTIAPFTTEN